MSILSQFFQRSSGQQVIVNNTAGLHNGFNFQPLIFDTISRAHWILRCADYNHVTGWYYALASYTENWVPGDSRGYSKPYRSDDILLCSRDGINWPFSKLVKAYTSSTWMTPDRPKGQISIAPNGDMVIYSPGEFYNYTNQSNGNHYFYFISANDAQLDPLKYSSREHLTRFPISAGLVYLENPITIHSDKKWWGWNGRYAFAVGPTSSVYWDSDLDEEATAIPVGSVVGPFPDGSVGAFHSNSFSKTYNGKNWTLIATNIPLPSGTGGSAMNTQGTIIVYGGAYSTNGGVTWSQSTGSYKPQTSIVFNQINNKFYSYNSDNSCYISSTNGSSWNKSTEDLMINVSAKSEYPDNSLLTSSRNGGFTKSPRLFYAREYESVPSSSLLLPTRSKISTWPGSVSIEELS